MTITIHAGHNPKGKIASGASGYLDESTESRKIVKKVTKILKKKGVKTYDCTVNDGISQRDILQKICAKCNKYKRDYDISVHFNACAHSKKDGKTKGTECHVYNMQSKTASDAAKICDAIARCGLKNRGVWESKKLYFLKHTNKPAILIEVCFVDDADDAALYKKSRDVIASAIAETIAKFN